MQPGAPLLNVLRRGDDIALDSIGAIRSVPALQALAGRAQALRVLPLRDSASQLMGCAVFIIASDRVPGLVGVSAPVWRGDGQLVGALTLTVPEARFRPPMVKQLRAAATRLCALMAH